MRNEVALALDTLWRGCAAYANAGALVTERPVRWFATGAGYEALNGVFLDPAAAGYRVPDAVDAFRARGVPALWHVGSAGFGTPPTPPGLRPYEVEPLMLADLDRISPRPVAGLSILPAHTEAGIRAWVRTWTGEYSGRAVREATRLRHAAGDAFTHLLAVRGGAVIGCAAAFAGPAAGEVQHVVTVPGERLRGVGTALTAAALCTLRGRGLRTAVLTSSPDGEGIYRRLGFRPIGRVHRYLWSPVDGAEGQLITHPDVFGNNPALANDVPVQGG